MPTFLWIPAALLVISLLVIIHEFGHYVVARAFGMRVLTYSIGFGPTVVRWRPKGSETVFQIAAIPVLAYVQIAGMNPQEAVDPSDRGSYQNATPIARFLTIAAGPLANYLAAALALFVLVAAGGEQVALPYAQIGSVIENTPAAAAGLRANDTIRAVNGHPVPTWEDLVRAIQTSNGHALTLSVDRGGRPVALSVTPQMNHDMQRFTIGVEVRGVYHPVPVARAARMALVVPALMTGEYVKQIVGMFQSRVRVQLVGPVGIVTETVHQARHGWRQGLDWVGNISLQLFIFNLLPIPALDGGRLVVLGYEMTTKRRPNPRIEARVLAASLMLMLGLFLVVTSQELWHLLRGLL